MLRNKVLNIIAYTHVLIPHIERKIDQLCAGYSWPQDFYILKMEDDFDEKYLLEKSNKYLGFDLLKLNYDAIYEIEDLGSFSKKIDNIKVKDITSLINYFIKIDKFNDIIESEFIRDESYYTLPDGTEMDILEYPFQVHGADVFTTHRIKDYYNQFIFERKIEKDKFIKNDKWIQVERDLKISHIID